MVNVRQQRLKRMVTLAMLATMAYVVMLVGRFPVVLFLSYDPKDIIIVIGGLIYGPLASAAISVVVSLVEMLTVSGTGWIGFIMNVLSSCSFACTASFIYKKMHNVKGAAIGLVTGALVGTVVMLLWNYLITPLYMDTTRADVASMLIPYFLPFNLLKHGLNAGITMLIYKPVVTGLRKAGLLPKEAGSGPKKKLSVGVLLCSLVVLATLVLLLLAFMGII